MHSAPKETRTLHATPLSVHIPVECLFLLLARTRTLKSKMGARRTHIQSYSWQMVVGIRTFAKLKLAGTCLMSPLKVNKNAPVRPIQWELPRRGQRDQRRCGRRVEEGWSRTRCRQGPGREPGRGGVPRRQLPLRQGQRARRGAVRGEVDQGRGQQQRCRWMWLSPRCHRQKSLEHRVQLLGRGRGHHRR